MTLDTPYSPLVLVHNSTLIMSAISSESDHEQDDLLDIYTRLMLDSIDVPSIAAVPEPAQPTTTIQGGPKSDGMNAKQRKLEKKKVKREESKRVKADLVEEAGES